MRFIPRVCFGLGVIAALLALPASASAAAVPAGYGMTGDPWTETGIYGPLAVHRDSGSDGVIVVDLRTGRTRSFGPDCPRSPRHLHKMSFLDAVSPDGAAVYAIAQLSPPTRVGKPAKGSTCAAVQAAVDPDADGVPEQATRMLRLGLDGKVSVLGEPPAVADGYLIVRYGRVLYGADSEFFAYDPATGQWSPFDVPSWPEAMEGVPTQHIAGGRIWGADKRRVLVAQGDKVISSRKMRIPAVRAAVIPPRNVPGGSAFYCTTKAASAVARGLEWAMVAEDGRIAWALSASKGRGRVDCKGLGGVPDLKPSYKVDVERYLLRSSDGGVTWKPVVKVPRVPEFNPRMVAVVGRTPVFSTPNGFARFSGGSLKTFKAPGIFYYE